MTDHLARDLGDVNARVRRLIVEVLFTDEDQLDDTVPLVDYGMDSLRAMSIVTALEHEFRVSLTDDVVVQLQTAGQITRYLATGEL